MSKSDETQIGTCLHFFITMDWFVIMKKLVKMGFFLIS